MSDQPKTQPAPERPTPGPWRWVDDEDHGWALAGPTYDPAADADARWDALVLVADEGVCADQTVDVRRVDELLLASAPDLLAALDGMLRQREKAKAPLASTGKYLGGVTLEETQARAALARARGEA